jgi:hypothetical protein
MAETFIQAPAGKLVLAQADSAGNLKVSVTGAGSGGTSSVDEAAFTPGESAGTPAMGAVNPSDTPANGVLAIVALDSARNMKVNIAAGSITVTPPSATTIPNTGLSAIATASVQLLAANSSRVRMILQNVGTTNIYVLEDATGSGSASATNFTYILRAGGSSKDGSSPIILDTVWKGRVVVCGSASGGLVNWTEETA